MIKLTDADRAEIDRLSIVLGVREHEIGIVYCAGMAAMAERAAKVCENHPSQMANLTYAAAIRALVKPS